MDDGEERGRRARAKGIDGHGWRVGRCDVVTLGVWGGTTISDVLGGAVSSVTASSGVRGGELGRVVRRGEIYSPVGEGAHERKIETSLK